MNIKKLSRSINWLSSVEANNRERLEEVQAFMNQYYSSSQIRSSYNQLIPVKEEDGSDGPITECFLEWIQKEEFQNVLEIGCGNGRILKKLEEKGIDFIYTGIEVDTETIDRNKRRWPNRQWSIGSVYNIPLPKGSVDLCMSFYVLEHLVFPEEALNNMFETLKPGGKLLIVCPDFAVTTRFPSQNLANSTVRSTKQILKSLHFLKAFNFFVDNTKMKNALKKLHQEPGKFLVNASPVCLHYKEKAVWPDIDAVYITSKPELEYWAKSKGAKSIYPFGKNPPFDEHIFIVIEKAAPLNA